MRLLAVLALCAAEALAGMAPVKEGLRGSASWRFTVLDGRVLYKPSPKLAGTFDAVEVHQSFKIEADGTGALKNVMGPAGQSRMGDDDAVAGKDFPGHDRIRLAEGPGGAMRLEFDVLMSVRDGSVLDVAGRYSLPLQPFGNGWAVMTTDAARHFSEQARMQGESNLGHLRADGWKVESLKAAFTAPKAEHALRLVPEDGGWRLLSSTPYVLQVHARLSR
jgi:hypothetical protein